MLINNNLKFEKHKLYLNEVAFSLVVVDEHNAYLEREKTTDMMKGTGQIHPDRPYLIKSYDSNFIAKGANKLEWDLDDRHTEQDIEDFMEYMKSEYGWANPKFHRFGNVLKLDTHGKDFDITEYREFPFQKWSFRNEHSKLSLPIGAKMYCFITSGGPKGDWVKEFRELPAHATVTLEPKSDNTLYTITENVVTSDSNVIAADTPTHITSDTVITNHNDVGLRIVRVWKPDS